MHKGGGSETEKLVRGYFLLFLLLSHPAVHGKRLGGSTDGRGNKKRRRRCATSWGRSAVGGRVGMFGLLEGELDVGALVGGLLVHAELDDRAFAVRGQGLGIARTAELLPPGVEVRARRGEDPQVTAHRAIGLSQR